MWPCSTEVQYWKQSVQHLVKPFSFHVGPTNGCSQAQPWLVPTSCVRWWTPLADASSTDDLTAASSRRLAVNQGKIRVNVCVCVCPRVSSCHLQWGYNIILLQRAASQHTHTERHTHNVINIFMQSLPNKWGPVQLQLLIGNHSLGRGLGEVGGQGSGEVRWSQVRGRSELATGRLNFFSFFSASTHAMSLGGSCWAWAGLPFAFRVFTALIRGINGGAQQKQ